MRDIYIQERTRSFPPEPAGDLESNPAAASSTKENRQSTTSRFLANRVRRRTDCLCHGKKTNLSREVNAKESKNHLSDPQRNLTI